MDTTFTDRWMGKFRILTLSLIFSGALNIGLIAALTAFLLQDRKTSLSFARPSIGEAAAESTNSALISAMSKLSFRELCAYLTNKELVEEGYSRRDLALAVLVAYRHFDLEKALGTSPQQRRLFSLGADQTVEMFPGLTDEQFKAVLQFVYLEKWPLTPEGLFKLVQKTAKPREESLDQAFALTPPFYALQVLFQKTEVPQEIPYLIDLASEGNWDLLDRFEKEQAQMLDLSVDKRRRLLLSYLAFRSPTAAQILIRTDFAFAVKRLNDQGISDLLDLLKGEEARRFCLELLKSPRSDAVWEKCARLLYAMEGEPLPVPFDLKTAMRHFAPTPAAIAPPVAAAAAVPVRRVPAASIEPVPAPAWIQHTVKDGESLWKIARQYKVTVDAIAKANDLEKDKLRSGMTLKIPAQRPSPN